VGLATIKSQGGATIVQDPQEALYSGMPASALANVTVDAVAVSDQIAEVISSMVNTSNPPPDDPNPPGGSSETDNPATTTCPECGGVLTEHSEAGLPLWSCEVGHRYSTESLADAKAASAEAALWTAIRALLDHGALLEHLARRSESRGERRSARSFHRQAASAREHAETVREALGHAATGALRTAGEELGQDMAEVQG
jgi:two-component system chemotaxis response regulator CheB